MVHMTILEWYWHDAELDKLLLRTYAQTVAVISQVLPFLVGRLLLLFDILKDRRTGMMMVLRRERGT